MADQGVAPDEQQLKQRAMRRLAVALTLIALAIAGLALLDRYHASQKKPEVPSAPPEQQALPGEPATRPPAPSPATEPPAAQPTPAPATPQRTPQATPLKPVQPPAPPPPVVSNEPLPRAESNQPAPKASNEVPEDTTPATKPAPIPATAEKATPAKPTPSKESAPPAAAKPAEQPAAKGFIVQVGVFSTPEHARALQAKLAEKGIQSSIETRVVVGPFKDRAEADAVTKQLKDLGLQGVVIAPH
jgi:DedD protein